MRDDGMTRVPHRSLPSDENRAAFVAYRRDRSVELRNEIVTRHLDLARAIAWRFARRGEPLDDLTQVATFGLIKAVERFDPDLGAPFESYAIPTMIGEIKRHFRDRTWAVHVGRPSKDLLPRLRDAQDTLAVELGRSPSASELACVLHVGIDAVLETIEAAAAYRPSSLSELALAADRSAVATLGAEDSGFGDALDRITVERLLSLLPEPDRRVVELRYFDELTQREIATHVGVSQMQISRVLRRALGQLNASDVQSS